MALRLKNLSNIPFDVPTTSGPIILPAYGEIVAELNAYESEAIRHSGYVHVVEDDAESKPADVDDLRKQYEELRGEAPDKRWGAARLQSEIDKALAE